MNARTGTADPENENSNGEFGLYNFLQSSDNKAITGSDQINRYFMSKLMTYDFSTQYPAVAVTFKKLNATLPSSEPEISHI